MRLILSIVFCFLLLLGNAQFSSDIWHDGYLVTSDKDTLQGKVKYDMENNSIQFYNEKVIRTFSSYQVFYFNIFDELLDNYRQFYCIPYRLKTDYKTPIIFELLYEGELSLMAREAVVQESVPVGNTVYSGIRRDRLQQQFFFVDKKGRITSYKGKRGELLAIMSDKSSQVKTFMKKNRLKSNTARDLVRVTAFYNSI